MHLPEILVAVEETRIWKYITNFKISLNYEARAKLQK